jgi:hypothetical protein
MNDLRFATWCILRASLNEVGPYTESQFETLVNSFNIPFKDPSELGRGTRSKSRPLQVGEVVMVKAKDCHELNRRQCGELNFSPSNPILLKVLEIRKADNKINRKGNQEDNFPTIHLGKLDERGFLADSSVYVFHAVPPSKGTKGITSKIAQQEKYLQEGSKRYNESKLVDLREQLNEKALMPNESLGIYRAGFGDVKYFQKYLAEYASKTKFEVVYKFGTQFETPQYRSDFRTEFTREISLENSELKKYGNSYFEGVINYHSINGKGQKYAQMDTRKMRGTFTSLNPTVGSCYYIGKVGERPSGWEEELEEMLKGEG